MRLLFVDTRVEQHQLVVDSIAQGVVVVTYDSKLDTAKKILTKTPESQFESVAWFGHAPFGPEVALFGGDPPVAFNAPPVHEFVADFWKPFVQKTSTPIIDFLGCKVLQDPSWLNFLEVLRAEAEVVVRASDDDTGALKKGGDWVLESHDVNVKNIYFTNTIDTWNSTLQTYEGGSIIKYHLLSRPFDRFGPFTYAVEASENPYYVLMDGKVRGPWNRNTTNDGEYGMDPPANINDGLPVMRIYSSGALIIALKVDGTIVAWSRRLYDAVGDRTHEYGPSAPSGGDRVVKVWANGLYGGSALCLTETGHLIMFYAWGTFQRGFGSSGSSGAASASNASIVNFDISSNHGIGPFTGEQAVQAVGACNLGFYVILKDGELMIIGRNTAYSYFAYQFNNYSHFVNGTGTMPPGQTDALGHGFDSLTTYKGAQGPKPVDIVVASSNGCIIFDEPDGTQSAMGFGYDVGYTQTWVKNFKKALTSYNAIYMLTTDGKVHGFGTFAGGVPAGYGYQASAFPNGAWDIVSNASDPVVDIYTSYGGACAITQSGLVANFGRTDEGGNMPPSGFTVNLATHRILRWKKEFVVQDKSTTHITEIFGRSGATLSTDLTAPGKEIVSLFSVGFGDDDAGFVHYADGEVRYLAFSHSGLYSSSFNNVNPQAAALANVSVCKGPGPVFVDTAGYVRGFGYAFTDWHGTGYLKTWAETGKSRSAAIEDIRNIGASGYSFDLTKYQVLTDPEGQKYYVWDGTYIDSWAFSGWDLRTFDLSRVYTYDLDLTGALLPIPKWRLNYDTLLALPETIDGDDNPTITEDDGTGASIFQGAVGSFKCIALKLYSEARGADNVVTQDTSLKRNYVQLTEVDNNVQLMRRSNTSTVSELFAHDASAMNFNSDFSVRHRDTANNRYQKLLYIDKDASTFRNTIQTWKDEEDTTPTFSVNAQTGVVTCASVQFPDGTTLTTAPSGPSFTDLDVASMSDDATVGPTNKNGVCFGNRWYAGWFAENHGFFPPLQKNGDFDWRCFINGVMGGSYASPGGLEYDGKAVWKGYGSYLHLDLTCPLSYRYNFNGFVLWFSYTGTWQNTAGLGTTIKCFGSNDSVTYTELFNGTLSHHTSQITEVQGNGVTKHSGKGSKYDFNSNKGYYKIYRFQWGDMTTYNQYGFYLGDADMNQFFELEFY